MTDHTEIGSDAIADDRILAEPLVLPCGVVLANRLVKAAMSDSLGDGAGRPTEQQIELYRRWSAGGTALSLIGEVQVDHRFAEKPGNLVLGPRSDDALLRRLADAAAANGSQIWPQLGHAGALAHIPISNPAGPSALDLDGLRCDALTAADVDALPPAYARAAAHAQAVGFGGVEIHAGHGFLLSQFLSPLCNHRTDRHGGSIEARTQLLVDIVRAVRAAVGVGFAIAVKINSSDQLEGGLDPMVVTHSSPRSMPRLPEASPRGSPCVSLRSLTAPTALSAHRSATPSRLTRCATPIGSRCGGEPSTAMHRPDRLGMRDGSAADHGML